MTASCVGLLHAEGLLEILQCRMCTADRTVHNKLLQLTVHSSVQNISYTKQFPAVLLHARNQYIEQQFHAIIVFPNEGPVKHQNTQELVVFIILL
jgi:hypothetical protein